MKKLNTLKITNVYQLVNNGSLAKIEKGKDRYSVIKALRLLKPIAEDYEMNRVETVKRLREGHEEECSLLDRMNMRDQSLTPDELIKASKFAEKLSLEVSECMEDIANKEHSLDFEPITEDAFMGLLEGNDWHAEDCMFLEDLLR